MNPVNQTYLSFNWYIVAKIIIQWGAIQIINGSGIICIYPISFTNTQYVTMATHYNGVTPSSVVPLSIGYKEITHCYVSNNTGDNPAVWWLAVGY